MEDSASKKKFHNADLISRSVIAVAELSTPCTVARAAFIWSGRIASEMWFQGGMEGNSLVCSGVRSSGREDVSGASERAGSAGTDRIPLLPSRSLRRPFRLKRSGLATAQDGRAASVTIEVQIANCAVSRHRRGAREE